MVSKANFQQNQNRAVQMQQQQRSQLRASIAPYRKPFRPQLQLQGQNQNPIMYTSSQMPSDPLYIDFNSPSPAQPPKIAQALGSSSGSEGDPQSKRRPPKGKQPKGKPQSQSPHQGHQTNGHNEGGGGHKNWQPKQRFQPPQRFNGGNGGGGGGQRNGGGFHRPPMGGPPNRGGGGRPMMPPIGPLGPRGMGGGMMPPYAPFQPPMPPMRCPLPPMGGPLPPFVRRNGRGGGPNHPPLPPPLNMGPPHMMGGPRMPPRGPPPGGPFGGGGMNGIMNGGKIKKPNAKLVKQAVKGKSTIKTLKNLVNQYPIDKPWVTEDIRGEFEKKADIENRLKGHKDDELFAQFKVQRDKFVAMYEKAREEYLKQEAASVMAKDAKDKDKNANTNQNTTAKDATNPIPKSNKANELTANATVNAKQQQEQQKQDKAE